MENFYVLMEGTWECESLIRANSREEAIDIAMQHVDRGAYSIDHYHTQQWLDGEEDDLKKAIQILDLESDTIYHRHHAWQGIEDPPK